jgi:hypothetical protein
VGQPDLKKRKRIRAKYAWSERTLGPIELTGTVKEIPGGFIVQLDKASQQALKEIGKVGPFCRHGLAFDKHCGECWYEMHAPPAACKPRRG